MKQRVKILSVLYIPNSVLTPFVNSLDDLAWQTDKGNILASALLQSFRGERILLPTIIVIERIFAEAITNVSRRVYSLLTEPLTKEHFQLLNALLMLKRIQT